MIYKLSFKKIKKTSIILGGILILEIFLGLFLIYKYQLNIQASCFDEINSQNNYNFIPKEDYERSITCELEKQDILQNWKLYIDQKNCFSIQYPEDWHWYIYNQYDNSSTGFNNKKVDMFDDTENKISIEIRHISEALYFYNDSSDIYHAKRTHLFSLDDMRISGYIEEDSYLPWKYLDRVLVPISSEKLILVITYRENEYNEKDRDIFDKMIDSLQINFIFDNKTF